MENIEKKYLKFKVSPLCFSLIIYGIISAGLIIRFKGNLLPVTGDFDFYNSFLHRYTDFKLSDISTEMYINSPYIDPKYNESWIPNPFYSFFFLAPITFLGSPLLMCLIGASMGVYQLILFNKLLNKLCIFQNKIFNLLSLTLIPLNLYYVRETLTVSITSVAILFFLIGFTHENKYIKSIAFIIASITRVNSIFFLFFFTLSLLFFKPKNYKKLIRIILPCALSYFLMYYYCYSSYPGSGLNFIFLTYWQGINYAQDPILETIGDNYGIDDVVKLLNWNLSFPEFFKIFFTNPKILSNIFHIILLKISISLGFVHEKVFASVTNSWLIKFFISIYALLIIIPGFLCSFLGLLSRKFNNLEKTSYLAGILYMISNSIFLGDPRYSIGLHFLFILALIRVIEIVSYENKNHLNYQ